MRQDAGRRKKLLFFITDWKCPEKSVVSSTLSWLAEGKGMLFDHYIQKHTSLSPYVMVSHECGGSFFNDFHAEQFYYICNCFDVAYCSIEGRRFLKDLKTFGKKEVSIKQEGELFEFYREVFSYFDLPMPETAVMVRTEKVRKETDDCGFDWHFSVDAYCFPEIYYRKAIGLPSSLSDKELRRFQEAGVKTICTLFCSRGIVQNLRKMGFKVKALDSLKKSDTLESIICRMAERWLGEAEGLAYVDPVLAAFWLPFFIRERKLCIFSPNGEKFAQRVAEYADKIGTDVVWGRQTNDFFVVELSKHGKVMQIIDHNKPMVSVKNRVEYAHDYIKPAKSLREAEYSDSELERMANENKIAVTLLLFAPDLRHFTGLGRIIDSVLATKGKVGIAITAQWYEYFPELLEDTLIPFESGGTFPLVELLLCSGGLGAGTEAEGYLPKEKYLSLLQGAREVVEERWGKELVPKGYYSFQDASPDYRMETGQPQFDVVREAGFEYYITYKDSGKEPRIVYEDQDFIAINQQNIWQWERESPLSIIKNFEERIFRQGFRQRRPGWIIIGLDFPFWGWYPFYLDMIKEFKDTLDYIARGGSDNLGKGLVTATPHEVARYAKVLQRMNLLKTKE